MRRSERTREKPENVMLKNTGRKALEKEQSKKVRRTL